MRRTYKIIFLGDSNVGKTTLMSQYLYRHVESSYGATIGLDFVSTTVVFSGVKVRLQLWDTAGQERFNSIIPSYTRNSFLAVIVFDMTDKNTFDNIDHWVNDLVRINDPNHKVKILIVGNKKELVAKEKREEYRVKGVEKAQKHHGKYVETYAMEYRGISELIKAIKKLIEENLDVVDDNVEEPVIVHSDKASKWYTCC